MMVDLGVPLRDNTKSVLIMSCMHGSVKEGFLALALTLSNEGGLTMLKQIRKTSVWG